MQISKVLNQLRPAEIRAQTKPTEDFNRPAIRFSGKTYDPAHPMYESIRRMVLDRYRGK